MKLLFSEYGPDYSRYLYPYVVLAVPEAGETPADLYEAGFHPASPALDRFTLCRHLRLALAEYEPSSENRRILRKGAGLTVELVERGAYGGYDAARRERWLAFAGERFGPGVMTGERLDGLMSGRVVSHLLVVRDGGDGGREVGTVLMYVEGRRMAHYYYAFYDRAHANRSLGLAVMTLAAGYFREAGFGHLYLGTCYSERALYKVQFAGLEFFDGVGWSRDLGVLKHLVRRDSTRCHLLQDLEYLGVTGGMAGAVARTGFRHGGEGKTAAGAAGVPA